MEETNNTIVSQCICGCNKYLYVFKNNANGINSIKCQQCGKSGPLANSVYGAKLKWDHMQTELKQKKLLEKKSKKKKLK